MTPEDLLSASAQPFASPPDDHVRDVDAARAVRLPQAHRVAEGERISSGTHTAPEGDEA